MTWYEKINRALVSVTDNVTHGYTAEGSRYIVWMEDAGADMMADNRHANKGMTGTADFFTKREFDPWTYAIEAAFDANGIAWELNSVQYEEETGLWHHEYLWTVYDGKV